MRFGLYRDNTKPNVAARAIGAALALTITLAGCAAPAAAPTTTNEPATEETAATQETTEATAEETAAPVSEVTFASWTEGSKSLKVLTDYVEKVTDESSPDYIEPKDRIAVFDLDGTLMCESFPWCFEYMVFADYALNNPNYQAPEDVKAVAQEIIDSAWGPKPDGMSTRQATAGAIAYQGLTPAELEDYVTNFKNSEAEGFTNMTRGEAWYKPMLEVVQYLEDNDFEIYIVTATERNIVRAIVKDTLNIDPAHVIGTEYGYTATGQGDEADGDYTYQNGDKVVFDGSYEGENAKMCKVDAIVREIGQQPVLAFGNSSGDAAMMVYTISDNPHASAAFMVLHDDTEREDGDVEEAAEDKAKWEELGFDIFSMKDDFDTIFDEGVERNVPTK
jgi:phosphoserine phosphatase